MLPQNIYEVLWIFMLYAFIGWGTEVAYAGVCRGIFVNRGFLNGPYCPIYGLGVLLVVVLLEPVQENLALLFLGSMLVTTLIEYLTGLLLEKVFHHKWWDYSSLPFNIKGYVCLKFSLMWGLGCTFIIRIIYPMTYRWITLIPDTLSKILIVILIVLFFVDMGATISTILAFNRRIRSLDELASKMRILSDEIGEEIFETVTHAMQKKEEFEEEHAEKRQQLELLKNEFTQKLQERHAGTERLLRAFPDVHSKKWENTLEKYKTALKERRTKQ